MRRPLLCLAILLLPVATPALAGSLNAGAGESRSGVLHASPHSGTYAPAQPIRPQGTPHDWQAPTGSSRPYPGYGGYGYGGYGYGGSGYGYHPGYGSGYDRPGRPRPSTHTFGYYDFGNRHDDTRRHYPDDDYRRGYQDGYRDGNRDDRDRDDDEDCRRRRDC